MFSISTNVFTNLYAWLLYTPSVFTTMAINEADTCYADAIKAIQPSVWTLRFTADWTEATPLFERAARLFKVWL